MPARKTLCLGVAILLLAPGDSRARHGGGGGGGGGGHGHGHGMGGFPMAVGGYAGYAGAGVAGFGLGWPSYWMGPGYYSPFNPALMPMGPNGFGPGFGPLPPPMPLRGPLLAPPPRQAVVGWAGREARPAAVRSDPARAAQLLTIGDRLFRAGNLKKAEERYRQALNAASTQAAPHLRLALLALTRGNYTEAANQLRDAETTEPGWVLTAPDIESIYGEPAEYTRQVARLESYVQAHPDDRDAWLVLGAHWFLSGRTARASDVFLRLNDPHRKPDVALAAFLIASEHLKPKEGTDAAAKP